MTTTKRRKDTAFRLHHTSYALAKETAAKHVEEEDGEKCFNLFTFLEELESRLDTVWGDYEGNPLGRFQLSPSEVARYLWCCLALEAGDRPDGTHFRGMPILD